MIIKNIFPPLFMSLLFLPVLMATSLCKTKYPANYKKSILFFGQGGGFTGAVTTYALLDNGRLFKKNSLTQPEFLYIGKLNKSDTHQLFNNYTFLGLPSMHSGEPGNIYHFIEYVLKNNSHKLTWGGPSPVPENLALFYSLLNHFIPKS
ncbi:MAG: hypothetical protein SH818_06785 [Saprospiraceae bacterium]|nr:hypothetical protein [Saprospiraceae bacterium]